MAKTPRKKKDEYPNLYEWRKDAIPRLFWAWNEEGIFQETKGTHINYFNKTSGVPVSGKVMQVKPQEYPVQMDIKEAFDLVKDHMQTKSKKLRKKMFELHQYEVYDLAALLEYLRQEWIHGNRGMVDLSYKEYYLLKPKKKTKEVVYDPRNFY